MNDQVKVKSFVEYVSEVMTYLRRQADLIMGSLLHSILSYTIFFLKGVMIYPFIYLAVYCSLNPKVKIMEALNSSELGMGINQGIVHEYPKIVIFLIVIMAIKRFLYKK